MLLERDAAALQRWIEDAVHGRVALPPGDGSPWDAFYAEYRDAAAPLRRKVDAAFVASATSPDVEVRGAVVAHWFNVEPAVAFPALVQLLRDHPALYAAQRAEDSSFTLRAWLLNGLAARASGTDAQDLILGALAGSGPLPGEVGTYFGGLGVDATEALVRAAPGGLGAIKDAGYELHRDPKVWADASARSVTWPAAARAALLAGGAEHAARFGGAPPQES